MLLRLKYEDMTSNAARGEVNGKNVNFFLRVQVDASNISEALVKLKGNKWVAGFDFVGEPTFLHTIDIGDAVVMVEKEVETVDENLDFTLTNLGSKIRVLVKLPKDYSDMKTIHAYSQKYPNIRFCGGNLIRLDGCNVGCIGKEDISKKIPDNRIGVLAEGCGCVFQNIHIDDVDTLEFYESKSNVTEKKVRSSGKPKSKTTKKPLSSLLSLDKLGGMDNF